jgi:hypothetical protein
MGWGVGRSTTCSTSRQRPESHGTLERRTTSTTGYRLYVQLSARTNRSSRAMFYDVSTGSVAWPSSPVADRSRLSLSSGQYLQTCTASQGPKWNSRGSLFCWLWIDLFICYCSCYVYLIFISLIYMVFLMFFLSLCIDCIYRRLCRVARYHRGVLSRGWFPPLPQVDI